MPVFSPAGGGMLLPQGSPGDDDSAVAGESGVLQ